VKNFCAGLLASVAMSAFGQGITFDATTNLLTIPSVQVGAATYANVTLLNVGNFRFALQGATAASISGTPLASYDGQSGILTLPVVSVGGTTYSATLMNMGDFVFSLQTAAAVQPYIYYSATSTAPQTATLDSTGTLTMGTLHLTGFAFAASATDSTGTLTTWAAPGLYWNQPNVPAMLFCGADGKIAYVLLRSPADDPNRKTTTVVNLLSAIQDTYQYGGIGVYTNCSGTFSHAWNNDNPHSDFNYWPDIFTSYSYATLANQLNGAPVFFESGATTSNPDNYLAIGWPLTGPPTFEIWK
jgi:hypothetical protein